MKYESSILKRLVDTYGVVGNPRYISEIIKEFIVRGKERFPELFTYQADWLAHIDEFGLNPTYTVSYTGQSIYAPNTLERPVKSAILKGCTGYRDIDTGEILETFEEGRNLELVSVKMPVLTTTGKNLFDKEKFIDKNQWGADSNGTYRSISLQLEPNTVYTMTRGSVSCTGHGLYVNVSNYRNSSSGSHWWLFHHSGSYNNKTSFTTNESGIIYFNSNTVDLLKDYKDLLNEVQLEKGDTVTSYEPFKSNILTVNEPVELRGIGDVSDTLDCLTGEVVSNFETLIIDGTENWYVSSNETDLTIRYRCNNIGTSILNENMFVCDKYVVGGNTEGDKLTVAFGGTTVTYRVLKSELPTLKDFKEWLNNNHHTFIYQVEKSIKTVGLTIHDKDHQKVERLTSFEGGTHFTTSSQEGSLLPTLTVDVVTDLDETLRVCSLEGNTL